MLRRLVVFLVVAACVTTFAVRVAGWWTQAWWFDDVSRTSGVDYRALYFQFFAWRAGLFVLGASLVGGFLGWQWRIATRVAQHSAAPLDIPSEVSSPDLSPLPARRRLVPLEDKLQLDRFRPWVFGGTIGLLAFLAGSYASLQWLHFFRFWHAGATGEIGPRDPIWNLDLGFYLFRLPALSLAWGFGAMTIVLAIGLVACLYAYEDVWELGGRRVRLAPRGLRHLSALLAFLMGWNALGHQLSRYNALSQARSSLTGIGVVDWYVRLPLSHVLSAAAVLVALFCLWLGRARATHGRRELRGRRIATIIGVYAMASWLLGTVVPAVLQRWWVAPQEAALEAPFLRHHWRWTRAAYALDRVSAASPSAAAPGSSALPSKVLWDDLAREQRQTVEAALDDLPLWPADAVRQWLVDTAPQQRFSTLHFDRYRINGEWRPVYVAARWTDAASSTWRQRHAAPRDNGLFICDARRAATAGHPLVYQGASALGLPDAPNALRDTDIGVVFGSWKEAPLLSRRDSMALRTATRQGEVPVSFFDRPTATLLAPSGAPRFSSPAVDYLLLNRSSVGHAASSETPTPKSFEGVELGGGLQRWLLALRFGDSNLALATQLPLQTRIAWHHDVSERCRQIAPSWTWGEPLPVVDDRGHITWLLDAFSLASTYPYARALENTAVNYLRAVAVAAVDARTGAVHLYVTDESDAFLNLYRRACPQLLRPLAQMPPSLRRHLRYPAPLLTAQAEMWARFHVENPTDLLRSDTHWQLLPDDPRLRPFAASGLPVRFNFSDVPTSPTKYFESAFCTTSLFSKPPVRPAAQIPRANATIAGDDREIVGALFATRDVGVEQLTTWQPSHALALQSMCWLDNFEPDNKAGTVALDPVRSDWSAPLFFAVRDKTVIGTQTHWPQRQWLAAREVSVAGEINAARQKVGLFRFNRLKTLQLAAARDDTLFDVSLLEASKRPPTVSRPEAKTTRSQSRSTLTTPRRGKATSKKPSAIASAVPNTERVLRQARALWQRMQAARQGGDWKAYGQAERALDKLLRP